MRHIIARLAIAAAMAFSNWAAGDIVRHDMPPQVANDERERLIDEYLPITHNCPQIDLPFTIRAGDTFTQDRLMEQCSVLKDTEDLFFAVIQTDPASPVRLQDLELLAFNSFGDQLNYRETVYGEGAGAFHGLYANSEEVANIFTVGRSEYVWSHEYVHHLDFVYNGRALSGHLEGLAEYISWTLVERLWRERNLGSAHTTFIFIGEYVAEAALDGAELPPLLEAWESTAPYRGRQGYVLIRFLVEEQPHVIVNLYKLIRDSAIPLDDISTYLSDALPPLTDDFHRWLRAFLPPTVIRKIEPITFLVAAEVYGNPIEVPPPEKVVLPWRDYIRTVRDPYGRVWAKTLTLSLSADYGGHPAEYTGVLRYDIDDVNIYIEPGRDPKPATVEMTLTATADDGVTAQLSFTVNLIKALPRFLHLKDMTSENPDPIVVSTVEGSTTIDLDLSEYISLTFIGPAGEIDFFEHIEFTVDSGNKFAALAEVRDGRIVITPLSTYADGLSEIVVEAELFGVVIADSFVIRVTDDCPPYLCRSFFNGWRWLLLEDGQALPETEAD